MKKYIINTGTVTYAVKGKDVLKRYGFKVSITKIAISEGSAGCGYAIIIEKDIEKAEEILKKSGVKILKITTEEI